MQQQETDPPDPTADWRPGLEEEPESPDPTEDRIPRSPPQPRECAETVRKQLLEKFNEWNSGNSEKKPVPKCLLRKGQWLLPIRMPPWLPSRDRRFHEHKKLRVFVCDTADCEQVVRYSSKETMYGRSECEFAGSFSCQDWDDLPPRFRKEAWEERFINATWHCTHICNAKKTLNLEQNRIRNERILRWQQVQAEAHKGREPASSSAASNAFLASGKGAKAGKMKRSWEEMQGGKSKGIKKGCSKDQGQASWRWTW